MTDLVIIVCTILGPAAVAAITLTLIGIAIGKVRV